MSVIYRLHHYHPFALHTPTTYRTPTTSLLYTCHNLTTYSLQPSTINSPTQAPSPTSPPRYSIPFFQGLPLDMTVSQIRSYIPEPVRRLRRDHDDAAGNPNAVSTFLDPRWDALGESQLRKWIRSHEDVGRKWYGDDVVRYYLS